MVHLLTFLSTFQLLIQFNLTSVQDNHHHHLILKYPRLKQGKPLLRLTFKYCLYCQYFAVFDYDLANTDQQVLAGRDTGNVWGFLRYTDRKGRQTTCFLMIKFRYHNEIVQKQYWNLPKNKYPIYLFQFMSKVIYPRRLEMLMQFGKSWSVQAQKTKLGRQIINSNKAAHLISLCKPNETQKLN